MRKWIPDTIRWMVCTAVFVGFAVFANRPAKASLVTFELIATGVTGGGVAVNPGNVTGVTSGSVIHLNMYVVLHEAVAGDGVVQVVGNLSDERGSFVGSFAASNSSPYSGGPGTQPGTQLSAPNGSLEIGSESSWKQGASDAVTGNTYFVDAAPGAASFIPVTGTPDSKGDLKLLVGTADYTVSNPSGDTFLYFFPHLRTDGDISQQQNQQFVIGGVQYRLDGSGSNAAAGVSNAFDRLPVLIFTPEPGAVGLGALGVLGLLLRPRRR